METENLTTRAPYRGMVSDPCSNASEVTLFIGNDNTSSEVHLNLWSEEVKIFHVAANTALCIVGILGNLSTIVLTFRNKKLKKSKSHWFIASLAAADLIFSALILPAQSYLTLFVYGVYEPPDSLCAAWSFLIYSTVAISMNSLLLMTVNRYVAIVYNPWYAGWYTTKSVVIQILLTWLYIYAFLTPPLFGVFARYRYDPRFRYCYVGEDEQGRNMERWLVVQGINLPCVIMIFLYISIFWTVRQSRLNLMSFRSASARTREACKVEQRRIPSKDIRLAKTMMITLIVMLVSYTPVSIIPVYGLERTPGWIQAVCLALAFSASSTNFIIYAFWNPQYRKAFKELFCSGKSIENNINSASTGTSKNSSSSVLKSSKNKGENTAL